MLLDSGRMNRCAWRRPGDQSAQLCVKLSLPLVWWSTSAPQVFLPDPRWLWCCVCDHCMYCDHLAWVLNGQRAHRREKLNTLSRKARREEGRPAARVRRESRWKILRALEEIGTVRAVVDTGIMNPSYPSTNYKEALAQVRARFVLCRLHFARC